MAHVHQGVFAVTLPDEKVPDYRIAASYAESPDEETPLDDLPTLADELLGPRDDDEQDDGREGRGGRRRR